MSSDKKIESFIYLGKNKISISIFSEKNKLIFKKDLFIQKNYLDLDHNTYELIEKLNYLEPYGSGNREPTFSFEDFKVSKVIETNNNPVKVVLQKGNFYIDSISFNSKNKDIGNYLMNYKKPLNVAGKIKLNEWNGKSKIELIIDDIQIIN